MLQLAGCIEDRGSDRSGVAVELRFHAGKAARPDRCELFPEPGRVRDRLFGFRLSYLMEDPKRGDIVIFKYPDNESINYIKRIIGLPGETVTIKDSKVYINNSATPLKEDYLKEEWVIANDGMQFQVPEGCYFMMGDNRNNSKDSRYWNNTYVARDKILAKAIFRYWGGFKLLTNTADYE